jgi:hypothetical protein
MANFPPAPQKKKMGEYLNLTYISTSPTNSRQESVIWFKDLFKHILQNKHNVYFNPVLP